MEAKGAINVYVCEAGHRTMTINKDEGTTPYMIRCTHTGCPNFGKSSFYRVPQPTHEWFKPNEDYLRSLPVEVREATRTHVEGGGLVMRAIKA